MQKSGASAQFVYGFVPLRRALMQAEVQDEILLACSNKISQTLLG